MKVTLTLPFLEYAFYFCDRHVLLVPSIFKDYYNINSPSGAITN